MKNSNVSWVEQEINVFTKSSSWIPIPWTPRPPRRCARNSDLATRLMYPLFVKVMTISSSSIKSSSSRLKTSPTNNSVRRSSPKRWPNSCNSVWMISRTRCGFAKMSVKSAINSNKPWYSFSILSRSKPVKRRKRISKIACAWRSDNLKRSIMLFFASSSEFDARIKAMISSIWSNAIRNPSKMWARASALFLSNCVRRVTTSCWCSM